MKIKFLTVIASLLAAAFMITSCLDDNVTEYEYSSNASITAFSIENIETQYIDSVHYGKDTTLVATVTGTDYPFVIDQGQRLIYNRDSLPMGTDVSKVVVNITADTSWILMTTQEEKDTTWVSTDSLNFENPVKFKVVAYSGIIGPTYTVKINVHKQVPDSLQWTYVGNGFDATIEAQKAVTLNDRIYVFAQQADGVSVTSTSISDGKSWTVLEATGLPDTADYSSVMVWGNELYILSGGDLYRSAEGTEWNKVETDARFSYLVANVASERNRKLYAVNTDNRFIESVDGLTWTVGEEVPSYFPHTNLSYAASTLETNAFIDRLTVMGDNGIAADTATVVWTRLTTENRWEDYPVNEDEQNYCPKLSNMAMIAYNKQLYAFGGPGQNYKGEIPAFSRFYGSEDQGVSWKELTQFVFFPNEFPDLYEQAEGHYSFVVDKNDFLWIIWSKSGQVWRGRINKLGFAQ